MAGQLPALLVTRVLTRAHQELREALPYLELHGPTHHLARDRRASMRCLGSTKLPAAPAGMPRTGLASFG